MTTLRPIDPARDLSTVSGIFASSDIADVGEPDHQDDWIVGTWRSPALLGAWIAERDGEAAAYLEIERVAGATAVDIFTVLPPAQRPGPLRGELISIAEATIAERAADATTLRFTGPGLDPTTARDAAAAGFAYARTFWHLERSLDDLPPPEPPPAGVEIRASIDPQDDEIVHGVLEEAFRGHYGIEPMTLEEWRVDFKDGMYDPELVLIATVEGEPVGVAANWLPDGLGWVGDLGVLASHRGRGIGRALLLASFRVLAERGATSVRLNVDGDNETGAMRLYTSVGMRERRRFDVFEKPAR